MSLKDELKVMADRLTDACPDSDPPDRRAILEIAAELRGMAKAMPDPLAEVMKPIDLQRFGPGLVSNQITLPGDLEIKAREDARQARMRANREEDNSLCYAEVMDGPALQEVSVIPVGPTAVEGSYTRLKGERYQMRGGKLYHDPEPGK